jgi:phosphoribosylamine---glycine ligase
MKILILGSGGREHAFAWKIKASPLCDELFIAPGNPGTAQIGKNVLLDINNFEQVADFCVNENIQMIVVGPEEPLVNGIYGYFQERDLDYIQIIGPSKLGAQLEGSKSFAKAFMQRQHIPTAKYREFDVTNFDEGVEYIKHHTLPIVLKADGLAAGKGVVIATSQEEALSTFNQMIKDKKFGEASTIVVIEEFLTGVECSVFMLTNGKQYVLLPNAKDYKRIGEGDTGLNTGGMGAISPVPFANGEFMQKVIDQIVNPTIHGLQEEQIIYHGFIFIGVINVDGNPFVIEYNCRMGDPETEVVLPRLENDLVDLFLRLKTNTLNEVDIKQTSSHAATVVLVSGGYPSNFEKGKEIFHVDEINDSHVFHAGTKLEGNVLKSNGGRVLAITSLAANLKEAVEISIENAQRINFEGKYFRSDIGYEFS